MRLLWHPKATQDIEEIWDYSSKNWGIVQADRYVGAIHQSAVALASGDLTGTSEAGSQEGLRRQVVGTHVIWFRIKGGSLFVGRVLHQSRDAGRWVG